MKAVKARVDTAELVNLMKNPSSKAHASRELPALSIVTHFDLWIATRMGDPGAVTFDYLHEMKPELDSFFSDVTAGTMTAELTMDLSGQYNIRQIFAEWSGWHYFGGTATPDCTGLSNEDCASLTLYQANSGSCVGGINDLSANTDSGVVA